MSLERHVTRLTTERQTRSQRPRVTAHCNNIHHISAVKRFFLLLEDFFNFLNVIIIIIINIKYVSTNAVQNSSNLNSNILRRMPHSNIAAVLNSASSV